MTETEDFLEMLKDPQLYSMKKAIAGLAEECQDIVEVDMSPEFDYFQELEVWKVAVTGTNVEMFQGMKLQEKLTKHIHEHTVFRKVSSTSPRYVSNLDDRSRDGYVTQEFKVMKESNILC